ncbi:MAG: IS66 family insertion sequence element accessory protein TnpA [Burkholderiales bacterium]
MRDRKRERYWLEQEGGWRSSGLSQSAYCPRHALSRVNRHNWIKRRAGKPGCIDADCAASPGDEA